MKYLFLLGCVRSGTTLLQQALNRHPDIVIPPETKFFSSFLGHSHKCQSRRMARLNADLGINLPPPQEPIQEGVNAREFFRQMADAYLDKLGRQTAGYFGEKTPAHSGYVPQIKRVFPEAKFVWIYRDGRDVAASMRRVPWMSQNAAVNMTVWLYYYKKQLQASQDKTLDLLLVKYEDLVTRPAAALTRVTDFLGLRYDPAMAAACGNREGILEWEYAWKSLALGPISDKRIGAWKTELSSREIGFIEWLGGRALRNLGYEMATPKRSWVNFIYYPAVVKGILSLLSHSPWDEVAKQLIGRPVCVG